MYAKYVVELQALLTKAGHKFTSSSSAPKSSKDWKNKGTYLSTILPIKLHIATSSNLLPFVLTFSSQGEAKGALTWMPCLTQDV